MLLFFFRVVLFFLLSKSIRTLSFRDRVSAFHNVNLAMNNNKSKNKNKNKLGSKRYI